jgi:hypothetical protein
MTLTTGCRLTLELERIADQLTPFDSRGCHVYLKKIQGNRLQKTRGVLNRELPQWGRGMYGGEGSRGGREGRAE